MRNVTAAVMASSLAFSAASQATADVTGDNWHPSDGLTQRSSQSNMFDGISLTEHQRQQLRDLMQRARHDQPPVNVNDVETMHDLVTAQNLMKTQCVLRQKKWHKNRLPARLKWQKFATRCITC